MMNRLFLTFGLLVSVSVVSCAQKNLDLLHELDSLLIESDRYTQQKENNIAQLKASASLMEEPGMKLKIYDQIFREYQSFRYDSAMAYADKGIVLARAMGNQRNECLFLIHKSLMLAAGGLYSEAKNIMDSIDMGQLDSQLLQEYYMTFFWLYTFWGDYSDGSEYSQHYRKLKLDYLKAAIPLTDSHSTFYHYLLGEYCIYAENDQQKAIGHYLEVLKREPSTTRLYSTSCFALAGCYAPLQQYDKYEEYLIRAAMTDVVAPVKENSALRELAIHLFNKEKNGNLELAQKYINYSLDDAKFYNNRLRIIEVSRHLPMIVKAYHSKVRQQNRSLQWLLGGITVMLLGLVASLLFIYRQNTMLNSRRRELGQSNVKLSELNGKLQMANAQLLDTNRKRENLAKLYIDLTANYIDKLSKYQNLVRRKIKANQVGELLSTMTSSRLVEEDAATFMNRFDKAFLDLYPTFVTEFNDLLKENERIAVHNSRSLTTELRIFALVRLGVKESSEIASLLFLAPRTIYNYRSMVKARAISRETFEEDVLKLCTVIREHPTKVS